MASGCKGSTRAGANTDTNLIVVAGSACVVNVSACNDHASTADPIEIYVVPNGGTKGAQHAIEKDVSLAAGNVIERTGIVLEIGAKIVVNSGNGTTAFNCWGVDLA